MSEKRLYRPNVAAFIYDENFQFLYCGRRDGNGFQLPQGGIELGETPEIALQREIREETNIITFNIVAKAPRTVKYEWNEIWEPSVNKYVGQEQTYFLVHISESEKANIQETHEFSEFTWKPIEHILETIVDFKKGVVSEAWQMLSPHFEDHKKNYIF